MLILNPLKMDKDKRIDLASVINEELTNMDCSEIDVLGFNTCRY